HVFSLSGRANQLFDIFSAQHQLPFPGANDWKPFRGPSPGNICLPASKTIAKQLEESLRVWDQQNTPKQMSTHCR
ncbi:MAG TPA: hypothetical protein VG892_09275, partial [Terriglobales bacterium]|nr:hypothetical protein [Terriglobales bacterium]